ncbi:hypothetical protein CRUP_016917 [Coryphaenoides rupestris]|nr:hypothetical protein CRUP_016917 [Coryphaenoides rupestris]
MDTPPGTKVKLLGTVPVKNGFLLLEDSKICVLGGEVQFMVEKWELQRSLAKHSRNIGRNIGAEGGPPPFVPFGQRCVRQEEADGRDLDRRKTLRSPAPVKPTEENEQFEKQRTAAIAEVAKTKERWPRRPLPWQPATGCTEVCEAGGGGRKGPGTGGRPSGSPAPVKPTEENEQFEKQRTAAIAEVAKTKEAPRTFGGGGNAGGNLIGGSGGGGGGGSSYRGRDANSYRRREERSERSEWTERSDSRPDGNYRELVDERALRDIMEMGFDKEEARLALMDNNNNLEAALNCLLTGATSPAPSPTPGYTHGPDRPGSTYNERGSAPAAPRPGYVHDHARTHAHHAHTHSHYIKYISFYSRS